MRSFALRQTCLFSFVLVALAAGCGAQAVAPSGGSLAAGSGPTEPSLVEPTNDHPSARAVKQVVFAVPWSCGYGFSVSNAQHTVALQLRNEASVPAQSSTFSLPDPEWEGHVDLGTNLLAVECIDLDLARLADPDTRLPISAGTVTVTAASRVLGCGQTTPPATATLTGILVRSPDGTEFALPDLTLTNDRWGCSAG